MRNREISSHPEGTDSSLDSILDSILATAEGENGETNSTGENMSCEISFADIIGSQDQAEKVNEALLQIEGGEKYTNEKLISLRGIIYNTIEEIEWRKDEKLSEEVERTIERIYKAYEPIERALFPMYSEIHERALCYDETAECYGKISAEEHKLLVNSSFMYQLFRNLYPNDRVPTEEEIGERMLNYDEYRKMGPVFMAHHMIASVRTNGPLPPDTILTHVTEAFWKDRTGKGKRITDWSVAYFGRIASRAEKWQKNIQGQRGRVMTSKE